jgi:hypothetical protein
MPAARIDDKPLHQGPMVLSGLIERAARGNAFPIRGPLADDPKSRGRVRPEKGRDILRAGGFEKFKGIRLDIQQLGQ